MNASHVFLFHFMFYTCYFMAEALAATETFLTFLLLFFTMMGFFSGIRVSEELFNMWLV